MRCRRTSEMLQVVFGRASDALAAAAAGQRALAASERGGEDGETGRRGDWGTGRRGDEERVRMAVHTGEVNPGEEIERGAALAHTMRLLLAAHGGQTLVSEKSASMIGSACPPGVLLRDLGRYRLSEGAAGEHLFQMEIDELGRQAFPPPRALPGAEPHLPLVVTRFFGREAELRGLRHLLAREEARLVTLTGPGGSSKTRLAIEFASGLDGAFPHAIWFVLLADLSDPYQMAVKVLDVMRLPRSPELDPWEQLAAALSREPCLLVLDNCEHLVAGGAERISTLLERAPGVRVLATSRCPLGLTAECEFPVPALPVPVESRELRLESPAKTDSSDLSTLAASTSVQLFLDRAQRAVPDFQLTPANAPTIASLCRQQEGLPLALELAAARVPIMTPAQILARLSSDRFDLLTTRKRDAPPRHRSLRLALDWSYQLLSPALQQFFARLSVFRGGWTLEAAAAILDGQRGARPARTSLTDQSNIQHPTSKIQDALEWLTQLREGSLVEVQESKEGMRFRLLESMREFGAEQLAPGEHVALERWHAGHFLDLAEAAEPHLRSTDQEVWIQRLDQDHDNLRVALQWGLGAPESESLTDSGARAGLSRLEIGLRLAGALWWFWHYRCHWTEGRAWLDQALARSAETKDRRIRAKILRAAGHLAYHQGDPATAAARLEKSRTLWQELGDRNGLAYSTMFLGGAMTALGDPERGHSLGQESVALFQELDDDWARGQSRYFLAFAELRRKNPEKARSLFQEGLEIFRQVGDQWRIAWGLLHLGQTASYQGDLESARPLLEESLAMSRALGNIWIIATALSNLGDLACDQQDYETARRLLEESCSLWRELGNQRQTAWELCLLGKVARFQGEHDAAMARYQEALEIMLRLRDEEGAAECRQAIEEVASRRLTP